MLKRLILDTVKVQMIAAILGVGDVSYMPSDPWKNHDS